MATVRLMPKNEIDDAFVLDRWKATFGDHDPATDASMVGPNRTRGDYWAAIANSPATVRYVWDGFKYLRSQALSDLHREIGLARAGYDVGSTFVFSQHCKSLRRAGWSEEKIGAITAWESAECYDDLERLLLALADDLVLRYGRVPPARFEALRRHLSDREIVEFIHGTLMYMGHATVCRALRVEYDDVDDRVEEIDRPA